MSREIPDDPARRKFLIIVTGGAASALTALMAYGPQRGLPSSDLQSYTQDASQNTAIQSATDLINQRLAQEQARKLQANLDQVYAHYAANGIRTTEIGNCWNIDPNTAQKIISDHVAYRVISGISEVSDAIGRNNHPLADGFWRYFSQRTNQHISIADEVAKRVTGVKPDINDHSQQGLNNYVNSLGVVPKIGDPCSMDDFDVAESARKKLETSSPRGFVHNLIKSAKNFDELSTQITQALKDFRFFQ